MKRQNPDQDNPPSKHNKSDIGKALIKCSLPPCNGLEFQSYEDYENHYASKHTLQCLTCQRLFPRQRILDLHITENHDPIAQVQKERGEKIYGCFVEGCDKLCINPSKRRLHVIDKHQYPRRGQHRSTSSPNLTSKEV